MNSGYLIINIIIRAEITRLLNRVDLANENFIESIFKSNRFYNIASGEEDNVLKLYFYAHMVYIYILFYVN